MIEKVRLKTQIIWYFTLILIVVKITRPLRSYQTPITFHSTVVFCLYPYLLYYKGLFDPS